MIIQYLIRLIVNIIAIIAAALLIPGIQIAQRSVGTYIILAIAFGLLNTFVRPLILAVTGRFVISTMGLFLLVLNGIMLLLMGWLFPHRIVVDGVIPALLGGALIAAVATFLETLLGLARPIGVEPATGRPRWYNLDRLFVGRALFENLRIQQVYQTIWRYGLDIAFENSPVADFRRWMQSKLHSVTGVDPNLTPPAKVRLMLQELGPIYVKMGQIVSSQSQALPREWQREMEKLQSNVPPFPYEEARTIIQTELGSAPEDIFLEFDPTPFAAASTAQVHRAKLPDGTLVVVKVQRPGILGQVKADVSIMTDVAKTLERSFPWAKDMDAQGMMREFGSHVIEELDYHNEAFNALVLARNMEVYTQVHVPAVYGRYSTSRVLTMEFVEGVKINNLAKIDEAGLDRGMLAQVLVRSQIKQLLVDGFFHGDPHPGNILVNLQTGVVQYLDMGMMGTLDATQRLNFADLIYTLYAGDIIELGHALINFSTKFKPFNERAFLNELDRVVGRFFMFPSEQDQFANSMSATLDVMYKHGLRLDTALTLAIKAMIQVEEAAFMLDPQMSLVEVAVDEGKIQFSQQFTYDSVKETVRREATRTVKEVVRRIPSLQDATLKWIEQYESGRLNLYVDTSDLAKQVRDFGTGVRYLTVGLIMLGLLLSTALVVGQDIPGLEGYASLAYLAFIVSIVLAVILLYQIWRRASRD